MDIFTPDFDLRHTIEAGQTFSWQKYLDGYIGCINETCFYITQNDSTLTVDAWKRKDNKQYLITEKSELEEIEKVLIKYFNINAPYAEILSSINKDKFIAEAIDIYLGIRVVKQPYLVSIICFMLSGNNNVGRVQLAFKLLSKRFGKLIYEDIDGNKFYSFPTIERLKEINEDDFRECNAGYRASFLTLFIANITKEDISNIENMSYIDAKTFLLSFKGIGEKISDCILLYAYPFDNIYPTDVWVKRFTQDIYFQGLPTKEDVIRNFGVTYFAPYAGWAQLFLYIFFREKQNK